MAPAGRHHGGMKGSVGGPIAGLSAILILIAMFVPFWNDTPAYELAIRGLWQGYAGLSAASFLTSLAMVMSFGVLIMIASTFAGSQALSFIGFVWIGGLLALFVQQTLGSATLTDYLTNQADWGFWLAGTAAGLALVAGFIPRSVSQEYRH
jgi:hypothetical protein